ncbi:hypothetical protein M2153_003957 [Pseudomonas sp. JUb96]|nr:hypothetical protein [Pseudomonas sp. JUb96]
MAFADRQTTTDLANTLLAEAHQHNFFQLLERLHGLHGDDLEPPQHVSACGYEAMRACRSPLPTSARPNV